MLQVQFTCHVRNGIRFLHMTQAEIVTIIENPDAETPTHKGRTNAWRKVSGGWIRVPYVIENDVIVIISVHPRMQCEDQMNDEQGMLVSYDPESDALFIGLRRVEPVDSREINESVTLDLDDRGRLVSIEILDATEQLGKDALSQMIVEGLSTLARPGEPATVYEAVP